MKEREKECESEEGEGIGSILNFKRMENDRKEWLSIFLWSNEKRVRERVREREWERESGRERVRERDNLGRGEPSILNFKMIKRRGFLYFLWQRVKEGEKAEKREKEVARDGGRFNFKFQNDIKEELFIFWVESDEREKRRAKQWERERERKRERGIEIDR
jgi:hypothetical protein